MLDIITIGSSTVDVFVETKQKHYLNKKTHHDICYIIGSKILIKNLHFSTGGGGTNTAASFSKLGLKTGWLGVLGKDHNSKLAEEELKKYKVKILGPKKQGMIGYSVILFGLQKDRTILTYKGLSNTLLPKNVPKLNANWHYISSMLGQSFNTTKKIIQQIKKEKKHWAFNPSTYLAKQGLKKLMPFIKNCDVLILNKEEAQLLTKTNNNTNQLLNKLQKYAKIVAITEGKKGASIYDGTKIHSIKCHNIKIIETTGAGDAFASGLVAGIIKGETVQNALKIAQAQSESVIQHFGAKNKLLTWKQIKQQLKQKTHKK